ncbi:Programmed cell death protein 2-like [Termitomyces sp. J132]|nr:Programmed cell death protein 2-like [Termitomyces sp. J132]
MLPAHEDDWSDSDDDVGSDVETSVLLGVPDGLVQSDVDISDAAVSRIGGYPAFLPSREPPFSSSHCKVCSNPCELLVQMWCPFEESPMDRALYVWGCAKPSCQGKSGSVRAWRGLRRNEKYAAKLEIKLAKKRAAEEAKAQVKALAEQQQHMPKKNPFSVCSVMTTNTFGIGAQMFGDTSPPLTGSAEPKPNKNDECDNENDDASDDESSSEDELLTAMASVTVTDSPWKTAPSYPPFYLSTVSEYLPPQLKSKVPPGTQITDRLVNEGSKGDKDKDISWASEAYEDSLEMDYVFERFTKRVAYEGEQCVRYELNGTPLPFSSDKIFSSLFPSPPAPTVPVTKGAFTVVNTPKRTYFPTNIQACPVCHGKRVFECQLMPNLINVVKRPNDAGKQATDEERRKAVERALKGGASDGSGMDWGTSMVFSCEKDCCFDDNGKEAKECWREEIVLVQAAI